jgi:hypothetical protein
MLNLRPSRSLTPAQIHSGLKLVIADGITAEAMVVFTSGTILTAMAINLGQLQFSAGFFAALTNVYHHLSVSIAIWLVQRFNNRRGITALFNLLARVPIITIGLLPFLFTTGTSVAGIVPAAFFSAHISATSPAPAGTHG